MSFQRLTAWYRKYERPVSSLSLIGGFVFDALTLRRVDTFWENFWIIIHLLVSAILILLINRKGVRDPGETKGEFDFWLLNLLQFTYGGLLSAFLVFYFRSAALSVSWPFLLLLALAFAANERLKRHQERLTFQISLFFLSLLSFAIFFVPVLVGSIGPWVFVLAGVASLLVMRLFLALLKAEKKYLWLSILAIFIAVNVLYFTDVLPPIPLSLKDGGIYYSVVRGAGGEYMLSKPSESFLDYVTLYPKVAINPAGQALYAYTAVFSPARFSTGITHIWQRYDESTKSWVTTSTVLLSISGGRSEGYRTFSSSLVTLGKWRVSVKTPGGQLIGRIGFTAVAK
ncbi:DUF2914 domain-containing protein [Candidatus Parcubacteria bacterium]|nr:DUF2914 domain-containing protein [Candidatus Parcubacteria bacterium]